MRPRNGAQRTTTDAIGSLGTTMARGQHIGRIDTALLARVDAKASELGQTRKVFTERALEAALREYEQGWPAVPTSMPSREANTKSSSLRNFMPKAP